MIVRPPAVLPAAETSLPSPPATLADIPEEEIWLVKQKSKRSRRAYRLDVQHFTRTPHIRTCEESRKADLRAVIAWERIMREINEAEPSTIRRRFAVLSSLFNHLVRRGHAESNPVTEVERPAISCGHGWGSNLLRALPDPVGPETYVIGPPPDPRHNRGSGALPKPACCSIALPSRAAAQPPHLATGMVRSIGFWEGRY